MATFVPLNSGGGPTIPDDMKPIMRAATETILVILLATPVGLRRNVLSSVIATIYASNLGDSGGIGDFDYLVEKTRALIRLANVARSDA